MAPSRVRIPPSPLAQRPPRFCAHPRRGGRAVECGGLENRYPSLGGSRVQIPPPPLDGSTTAAPTSGRASGLGEGLRPPEPLARRAQGVTLVVTLLVLFPDTGSGGELALTVAVSLKLPFVVGLTVRVMVAVAPFAIVPIAQTTFWDFGLGVQPELAEPKPAFFGS